jgi:DNA-binding FadR family transcriptional regulator
LATGKRRQPVHVKISKDLGVAIVTGVHPPGYLLPGEVEFAEQLGVSRSVVREALRMLAAKGLLESRPKAGTRIRERSHWNLLDPDLLGWMFEGAPPREFVRDLFQLRMIVEPAAAELAALGRSSRQLSRMGHALEMMQEHGLATPEGQAADQQFHAVILEATGNELLISLSGSISAAVRWTTFFKYRTNRHPRDPIPEHRVLFEAIADADAAAARTATEALVRQAQLDTEAALGAEPAAAAAGR